MEDFIMGFFSGAWGLKLILLYIFAKLFIDIIGSIAFFIYFNETIGNLLIHLTVRFQ